jgi:two-component system KDP operon response regulator KdpE
MTTGRTEGAGQPRVLIVDDEQPIRRFLRSALDTGEFALHFAENGREALGAVVAVRPDVVLLDLGLPDVDGVEVIRRIREWSQVPIIVLSAREREEEKVRALDAGADDYLTKPFGVGELQARIRVALRHALTEAPAPVFRSGDLEVDLAARRVTVRGEVAQLTPTEYDLLRLLLTHAGKVLTHAQILRQIWGAGHADQPHVLRVTMSNLRHKIEADPARPRHLLTELGVGYRLRSE